MKLGRMPSWLVEVKQWLAEGKIVFMGAVVIICAILLGFYTFCSETSIRLSGCALQLLGAIFAIRGLIKVRVHFGQPRLFQKFMDWWRRFPRWKKSIVITGKPAFFSVGGLRGKVELWAPDKPNQPIEKRFEGLLHNINWLKTIQDKHIDSIERLEVSLDKYKKEAELNDKHMEDRIKRDVELLHTSDFLPALIGIVWLIVGIFLSTMSPELYNLVAQF